MSSVPNTHSLKRDLTQGPITRHLLIQAIPMLIGLVVLLGTQAANTVFVTRLGEVPLAILGMSLPVYMIAYNVVFGFSLSTLSLVSRAVGAKDMERAGRFITAGLVAVSIAGVVMWAVGRLTIDLLFPHLGATPDMMPQVREFMGMWYVVALVFGLPIVGNAGMRGLGSARTASKVMVLLAVINLFLDVVLIFGKLGFPQLGLNGAAVATVVAYASAGVFALWFLNRGHYISKFRNMDDARALLSDMREVVKLAIPTMVSNLLAPVTGLLVMGFVAKSGAAAVAGYGVGVRFETLLLAVLMAISAALSPLVGQNFGAGNAHRTQESILKAAKILAALYFGIAVVLVVGGTTGLAHKLAPTKEAGDALALFFVISPLGYVAQVLNSIAVTALNAIGHARTALLLNLVKFIAIQLPLAWGLSHIMHLSGVFIGLTVGQWLAAIASCMVVYTVFWKQSARSSAG